MITEQMDIIINLFKILAQGHIDKYGSRLPVKQYKLVEKKHLWKNNNTKRKEVLKENTPSTHIVKRAFNNENNSICKMRRGIG